MKGIVHYNIEVEKYIIGALVLDKSHEVVKLQEYDFYNSHMQVFYRVINWMVNNNKAIDIISVSDYASKKIPDALQTLTEAVSSVTTTAMFTTHFEKLKMYSIKRQLLKKVSEVEKMVNDGEYDIAIDLKNDALQKLSEVVVGESALNDSNVQSIMLRTISNIENEYKSTSETKLHTCFKSLDNITAGLHNQELTILAARPGLGKTAFTLNILLKLAKKNNNCCFISREMSDIQLGKRLLSIVSGINSSKVRYSKTLSDDDWVNISKAASEIGMLPGKVYINDKILTIQEIRGVCRELKNKGELDVLFIDYLGLIKSEKKTESRRHEVEDVSRQLKLISMEFDVPVICLCQLNRLSETGGGEPELHHLRDSGAIEQDADNVWMLHEPEQETDALIKNVQLFVRKQRNGPTGCIKIKTAKTNFRYFDS